MKDSGTSLWLWLAVLVLAGRGAQAVNEEVPNDFRRLEGYRSVITQSEWREHDLRFGNEHLKSWRFVGDPGRQQVASGLVEENNRQESRGLAQLDDIDHEAILRIGTDETVLKAGEDLYNKQTTINRNKCLLDWDKSTGQFKIVKSKGDGGIDITAHDKLTVIGHGGHQYGKVSVGGKTSDQLAKVILSLRESTAPIHWPSNMKVIEEISIVSCEVGAGEHGETFTKEFLLGLKEGGITVGSVSVRTSKTIVDNDGRKVTIDVDDPELWSRHNPRHKRKFYLGEDNNLREESDTRGRSPEWIQNMGNAIENDPLVHTDKVLYLLDGDVEHKVPDSYIEHIIEQRTQELFNTEVVVLAGTEIAERAVFYQNPVNGQVQEENLEVRTIQSLDGLLDNIKYIIQTANNIRRDILSKKENIKLLKKYNLIGNVLNVEAAWEQIQNFANIKKLNKIDRAKFEGIIEEVDHQQSNLNKYYRFQDYVYSINMKNFYVEFHGAITREALMNEENPSSFRGKDLSYYDIGKMVNKRTFSEMANNWIHGNNIGNNFNVLDGAGVIASHISETVRNPRMFITNRLLWDITSSWEQFRNLNPMTGGGTWGKDSAAIGMSYGKAKEEINVNTNYVMKLWLSRKFSKTYNLDEASRDPSVEQISENAFQLKIETVDFPLLNGDIDYSCRPSERTLSENSINGLYAKEKVRELSLESEFQLKAMEDREILLKKIKQKINEQTAQDLSKYQKIKLIETYADGIQIVLENKQNPSETKKILMPGEKGALKSEELVHSYFSDIHAASGKVNHALGIYGTVMGFQAANQMFAEGRDLEGGIMLVQGVHGVTEITGMNAAVNDFVSNVAKQSITKISGGLEEAAAAKFTNSLAEVGELAKGIPVLSAAFTIFNIYEDLHQNTPIGIADAALDGVILITALAGPEMLPVTVALTIIRLFIDPLYSEIKHELDALPPNASVGQKFLAVIKGIGLALRDVLNTFVDILEQINIFGLIASISNLDEEHRKSMELVNQLQTVENYFKILNERDRDKCHQIVDFTKGDSSAYGGNLRVELTEHGTMKVTIVNPITSGKLEQEITFQKNCESLDLVMGIGEVVSIKLKQKSANIFWFIPVKTEEVITSVTADETSLHGTYIGNSKPNRFFAVQQNVIDKLPYTLDQYYYALYGNDGNDIFFLGPQKSFAHGGNGKDVYIIPKEGGQVEICNQANDTAMDLLIFNVPFQNIFAKKDSNDLSLFYNNNHKAVIKNWFNREEYKHLSFKTSDGTIFTIGEVKLNGRVTLAASYLDYSNNDKGVEINLLNPPWDTVVSVIGTNFSDVIVGNNLNNVLQGGTGTNSLTGHEGKDMYIIHEKETCDTIDNFAHDDQTDIVELPAEYRNLQVKLDPPQSVKIWDSSRKACVIIKDWKKGWQWQHIVFKSIDFVVFQVSNSSTKPELTPLILDYSDSQQGVNIDLRTMPGNENIMTVIDSPFPDTIIGNSKANFIKGGEGDTLSGGDGIDTYVAECKSGEITINNEATDNKIDILFINGKYRNLDLQKFIKRKMFQGILHYNLKITIKDTCSITLLNWLSSENFRHLQIQTEDGITFSISSNLVRTVYAVDNSRGTLPTNEIDTRTGIYAGATKIMGPPEFSIIYGNEKDNYIDPGTNSILMYGFDGSDTYIIRNHYEGVFKINNYANDHKLDYLILNVYLKDIQYKIVEGKDLLLSAPSIGIFQCLLLNYAKSSNYRHIIVKTNDVWFTFSDDKFELQPLFLDNKLLAKELHLNLSAGSYQSLTTVFGSLQKRNVITGNMMNNTIIGGIDSDVLYGIKGDDIIQGSGGKDYLSGGPGSDKIHGGEGNDLILGGEGNDVIYPGQGADTVYGGTGSDTLLFFGDLDNATGVLVNLALGYGVGADAEGDLYFGIENALGTSYDDILIGNDDDNYLSGGGGNDLIQPMNGDDVMHGGEGNDLYNLMQATGIKMIDNFANDKVEDLIYVGDVENGTIISFMRSHDDLKITFSYSKDADVFLGILVKNWMKSKEYKHLSLKVQKFVLVQLHLLVIKANHICKIVLSLDNSHFPALRHSDITHGVWHSFYALGLNPFPAMYCVPVVQP
ncbi:uncharacterized protein LOC108709311 [Xenopus laevis]|uniref:Uncharacterized protein LOC108709311 n=2 Tax=Xenopus laevis TaxID=8355 RepID=A0A1L8H5T7_XENLA|nr:uncharacterized protein LOC108709311 [Xenopus laevis]XP_041439477.1 uncharacterized protein LOC108709311 [Xenopus laevis]OCT91453.1 hypothetical protein XELAEV_18014507mg [Xenopus laevis]